MGDAVTPAVELGRAEPGEAFAALLLGLGRVGVELAPDRTDPDRLRFRPAALSPERRDDLARHKPAVLALLRGEGVPSGDNESAYVFEERLGIAEGLNMPVHPGSPAWLVAVGEAILQGCIMTPSMIY
jgi:hypothetical protein